MKVKLLSYIAVPALFILSSFSHANQNFKDHFKDIPPPCDWTGFYVGASLGNAWDSVSNSLSVVNGTTPYFATANIPGVNAAGSPNFNSSDMFQAIQAGYNYQQNEAVYGIELAANNLGNSVNRGGTYLYTTSGTPYTLRSSTAVNWLASLRPRIGLNYENFLFYVNGGLSVAKFKFNQYFSEGGFTPTPENPSFSQTRSGWNAGVGIEYRLTCHFKARAEYSFNRFSFNYPNGTLVAPSGSATFYNTQSFRNIHLLSLGINYSFSHSDG